MRFAVPITIIFLAAGCTEASNDVYQPGKEDTATTGGLDAVDRAEFYHLAEGSEVFPIAWARALEGPGGRPFFENPERFGLLADPDSAEGLPVGVTSDKGGTGVNCAACHTGQIEFAGHTLRIEGGQAMFNVEGYFAGLFGTAGATLADEARLGRFLAKVLPADATAAQKEAVIAKMTAIVQAVKARNAPNAGHTTPGPGRTDAFGTARNLLFSAADPTNFHITNAPVDYPHLWGFERIAWVQWNASTNSVLERNIGQAIGLGARPETLILGNIHRLEQISYKIESPVWPQDVLGAIDPQRKAAGEVIYKERCAGCHNGGEVVDGLYDPILVSLDDIGTDPGTAVAFGFTVKNHGGVAEQTFAQAIATVLKSLKEMLFIKENIDAATQLAFENGRTPTSWRDPLAETGLAYPARPLDGVWASPPYLHNGSVPTLDALLRPAAERPVVFPVGHREYDPAAVGYRTDIAPGQPGYVGERDTRLAGSSNAGHEGHDYGTDMTEDERLAVIEYLKSL